MSTRATSSGGRGSARRESLGRQQHARRQRRLHGHVAPERAQEPWGARRSPLAGEGGGSRLPARPSRPGAPPCRGATGRRRSATARASVPSRPMLLSNPLSARMLTATTLRRENRRVIFSADETRSGSRRARASSSASGSSPPGQIPAATTCSRSAGSSHACLSEARAWPLPTRLANSAAASSACATFRLANMRVRPWRLWVDITNCPTTNTVASRQARTFQTAPKPVLPSTVPSTGPEHACASGKPPISAAVNPS